MRFFSLIAFLALAASIATPAFAADLEFSASIKGFTLDLENPNSLPELGTIHFDPERGFNDEIALLARNSINFRPVFRYAVRSDQPILIQVRIEDITTGQKFTSSKYVATGSAGTKDILGEFPLEKSPSYDDFWSFLISVELRNGDIVSKIFHVYLIYPDFEPDIIEQNKYRSVNDPEPQTIYQGDYPPWAVTNMESSPETTGFLITDQNEAHLKDLMINPILYELIKARPLKQVEGEITPGSYYTYTVRIHWKPVVGTINYWSGFYGSGDNASHVILREKKVRLYIADPEQSEPNLHIELPEGVN